MSIQVWSGAAKAGRKVTVIVMVRLLPLQTAVAEPVSTLH
jgi:hypothetical protein